MKHSFPLFVVSVCLGLLAMPALLLAQETTPRALAGQKVTFTVTSDGIPPYVYQWKRNGADITGASSATFVVESVKVADAASYSVQVTDSTKSSVRSNAVTLAVTGGISRATLTVVIEPSPPLASAPATP